MYDGPRTHVAVLATYCGKEGKGARPLVYRRHYHRRRRRRCLISYSPSSGIAVAYIVGKRRGLVSGTDEEEVCLLHYISVTSR